MRSDPRFAAQITDKGATKFELRAKYTGRQKCAPAPKVDCGYMWGRKKELIAVELCGVCWGAVRVSLSVSVPVALACVGLQ